MRQREKQGGGVLSASTWSLASCIRRLGSACGAAYEKNISLTPRLLGILLKHEVEYG